jgi:hypothetical protein
MCPCWNPVRPGNTPIRSIYPWLVRNNLPMFPVVQVLSHEIHHGYKYSCLLFTNLPWLPMLP